MRIGNGYDVHQLTPGRKLVLGGIEIPHTKGLLGNSDADVLTHAIMDALLGSLALGSIGDHFPDTDKVYKDISSLKLLKKVYSLIISKGYIISNIDSTIVAQSPKLKPFIFEMRQQISNTLEIDLDLISIKATTTENLGFVGRAEGIAAYAVTLLKKC
jgi:2-C-methyl-D-erythritol 2,4-cyclodiphosphate synthase